MYTFVGKAANKKSIYYPSTYGALKNLEKWLRKKDNVMH